MKYQKTSLVVAANSLLALFSSVNTSYAALIAYDGFESGGATPGAGQYETGTGYSGDRIRGQGPATTGFSGSDLWSGDNDASFVYYQASGSSLTYTDGSGNALDTSNGNAQYTRTAASADTERSLFRTINNQPTPGGETWLSLMLRYEEASGGWNSTFDLSVIQGGRRIGLGVTTGGDLTAFAAGSGSFTSTVGALTANQDHLVIMRMENNISGSTDRISVWLDPTDLSSLGVANTVQEQANIYVGNNSGFTFDTVDIDAFIGNSGTNRDTVYFDEFRLGDTFSDVTPFTAPAAIPEPSAILLSGLGLAGLALRRRRR